MFNLPAAHLITAVATVVNTVTGLSHTRFLLTRLWFFTRCECVCVQAHAGLRGDGVTSDIFPAFKTLKLLAAGFYVINSI